MSINRVKQSEETSFQATLKKLKSFSLLKRIFFSKDYKKAKLEFEEAFNALNLEEQLRFNIFNQKKIESVFPVISFKPKEEFLKLETEKQLDLFKQNEYGYFNTTILPLFFNNLNFKNQLELFTENSKKLRYSIKESNYISDYESVAIFFRNIEDIMLPIIMSNLEEEFPKLDIQDQIRFYTEQIGSKIKRIMVPLFFGKLNIDQQMNIFIEETDNDIQRIMLPIIIISNKKEG